MKKPNIRFNGVKYSAYSERGKAIKTFRRQERRDKTHVPVSVLLSAALTPLVVQAFA